MKQKDLAEALGLHKSVLSRYVRKGLPTHSVEAAKAWYSQNIGVRSRSDAKPARVEVDPASAPVDVIRASVVSGPGSEEGFQEARTRREIAAANIAEMEEARLRHELIRVSAVEAQMATDYATTREALLQIATRLGPILAAESDPGKVQSLLYTEIHQALMVLAGAADRVSSIEGGFD